MSILQNAIDSIALGIEDYELAEADERRFISCTRNVFAGILLLFKHQLSQLSPKESDEALIKQKIVPRLEDGELIWIGEGKKTVDVQGIKDRFKSLNIETDWKRLDEINRYRNDIEHYHSQVSSGTVQKMISDSFLVIVNFIRDYLEKDPRELLGEDIYDVMQTINEVYDQDKKFCIERLETLTYFNQKIRNVLFEASCLECGSKLINPTDQDVNADSISFICRSCNNEVNYEEFVTKTFEKEYALTYRDVANGAEDLNCDCPECGGFFLYEDAICVCCGHEIDLSCYRCDTKISPDEVFGFEGLCSYCSYQAEKIMDE